MSFFVKKTNHINQNNIIKILYVFILKITLFKKINYAKFRQNRS